MRADRKKLWIKGWWSWSPETGRAHGAGLTGISSPGPSLIYDSRCFWFFGPGQTSFHLRLACNCLLHFLNQSKTYPWPSLPLPGWWPGGRCLLAPARVVQRYWVIIQSPWHVLEIIFSYKINQWEDPAENFKVKQAYQLLLLNHYPSSKLVIPKMRFMGIFVSSREYMRTVSNTFSIPQSLARSSAAGFG